MSAFASAAREDAAMVTGEKGDAMIHAGSMGDNLLVLFDGLVRGAFNIEYLMKNAFAEAVAERNEAAEEKLRKLILLAFQTRWCRGGKGEKDLFYEQLLFLYRHLPQAVLELLELIPDFGYWKDLFLLLKMAKKRMAVENTTTPKEQKLLKSRFEVLRRRVVDVCAKQHKEDMKKLRANEPGISLYAKFVPSEKGSLDKELDAVKEISRRVFGNVHNRKQLFRMDITALRARLDVTEVKMAGKRYSEIKFSSVPSSCMKRQKLAFLNDVKNGGISENGTRFPHDFDRVQARKNLLEALMHKGGIKGKQVFPHELVAEIMKVQGNFDTSVLVTNAQWESLREGVFEMIEARKAKLVQDAKDSGSGLEVLDMSKCVVLADVSGSMHGTPMQVSIAMGILCSEICHKAFRGLVMTFETEPRWVDLKKHGNFAEKVRVLETAPWGGSTNFYGAMLKIGEIVREKRLKQEDIPNLMVVSDMQFDDADRQFGSRNRSAFGKIKKLFKTIGMEVHGKALNPPNFIFWNVRSTETGFPAHSNDAGAILLSGYSPALMKFVLSGDMMEEVYFTDEDTGEIKKETRSLSPKEMLAKVLSDEGLEKVRNKLCNLHMAEAWEDSHAWETIAAETEMTVDEFEMMDAPAT